MARLQFGAIVTDMKGKLGGHVLQGNGLISTIRTGFFGKGGIHKRTQFFKELIPIIQSNWANETNAVKNDWAVLASKNPIIGAFRNWVFLSPQNMYLRHYSAFYASGQTGVIDVANAVNDLPSSNLQHVQFNFSNQELDVQFFFDRFSTATVVYALPVAKFNLSIHPKKLPFLYGEMDETPSDDLLWDAFFAKYPDVQEGDPVQFGVKQVNQYGFQSFVKTVYGTYV